MVLPAPPAAELGRLAQYNGNAYDEVTNPFGFAYGGHRQIFPQSLTDFAIVGNWTVDAALYLEGQVVLIDQAVIDAQHAAAAAQQSAEDAALFDPSSYYTKAEVDSGLLGKANADLSNVSQEEARAKVGTGTMAYRDVTISTAEPSGGANGDFWAQVE